MLLWKGLDTVKFNVHVIGFAAPWSYIGKDARTVHKALLSNDAMAWICVTRAGMLGASSQLMYVNPYNITGVGPLE